MQAEMNRDIISEPCLSDKISTVDIVDIILRLVLRPRVVYQREIKG